MNPFNKNNYNSAEKARNSMETKLPFTAHAVVTVRWLNHPVEFEAEAKGLTAAIACEKVAAAIKADVADFIELGHTARL